MPGQGRGGSVGGTEGAEGGLEAEELGGELGGGAELALAVGGGVAGGGWGPEEPLAVWAEEGGAEGGAVV